MPQCRFLCLALSRRDGGYCAAGLDLDTGNWVRPLNPKTSSLCKADIFVQEPSTSAVQPMRVLDIVSLPLDHATPSSTQPENWLLQTLRLNSFPQLLSHAQQDGSVLQCLRDIADSSSSHPFLFGDAGASVTHQHLLERPLGHSLSLIRPLDLVWVRSTDIHGNPRVRADFSYGRSQQRYILPVTDIEYERRLLEATENRGPRLGAKDMYSENAPEFLFTASLGENFPVTNRHYKLIAGVLEVPK